MREESAQKLETCDGTLTSSRGLSKLHSIRCFTIYCIEFVRRAKLRFDLQIFIRAIYVSLEHVCCMTQMHSRFMNVSMIILI